MEMTAPAPQTGAAVLLLKNNKLMSEGAYSRWKDLKTMIAAATPSATTLKGFTVLPKKSVVRRALSGQEKLAANQLTKFI